LPGDERFQLKLAATEALTNALKSSGGDPVRIRIVPRPEEIEVEVADRGSFGTGTRSEREGGRGIPLMLAWSTRCISRRRGRERASACASALHAPAKNQLSS
jgi:anti-sigma regulatory factor (Ser/Thr protein kinase)